MNIMLNFFLNYLKQMFLYILLNDALLLLTKLQKEDMNIFYIFLENLHLFLLFYRIVIIPVLLNLPCGSAKPIRPE